MIQKTFLLLAQTLIVITEHCNTKLKHGPYHLSELGLEENFVSNKKISVTKIVSNSVNSKMIIGYRSYWNSYCYQGGPLDPNTGCYDSLNEYPPTLEEMLVWEEKEKCQTGDDYTDSWGSDSEFCLAKPLMTKWYSSKQLSKINNNNHFAHHTCNRSWRCGISISKVPIFLECKINSDYLCVQNYHLPNGTMKEIFSNNKQNYRLDGEFAYLFRDIEGTTKKQINMDCFLEPKNQTTYCHEPGTETFMEMIYDRCSCYREICYCLHSNTDGNHLKVTKDFLIKTKRGESASEEDLIKIVQELHFDNLNLRYNLGIINSRFNNLVSKFNILTESVSKIDDRLIGNLMKMDATSEFVSNRKFFLSPCSVPNIEDKNCYNGSIYSEGRWVPNLDLSQCLNLNRSEKLDIFNIGFFHLPYLETFTSHELTKDLKGWSFVANAKQDLLKTMSYTKNGGRGTSLEDVVGLPDGYLTSSLHGLTIASIGSYITIIIFSILGCFIFKKFL